MAVRLLTCTLHLLLLHLVTGQCPAPCTCTVSWSGFWHVTCENISVDEILPLLPDNTDIITISKSQLKTLYTNHFVHFHLDELRELHLPDNDITDIQTAAFSGLYNLKVLDLSHNHLTVLNDTALMTLTRLKYLNLAANQFDHVPDIAAQITQLENLDLSYNLLTDLTCSAFLALDKLQYLYLKGNSIDSVHNCSFDGLSELKELSLQLNPIEHIDFAVFAPLRSLVDLNLSDTKLRDLPDLTLESVGDTLTHLSLAGSNLQQCPVWGRLHTLTHLDISENNIFSINANDLSSLSGLQQLFIEDMPTLETIESHAFNNLTNLRSVLISGNKKLKVFPDDAFLVENWQNVEEIHLNDNGIQKFTQVFLDKLF